MNLYLRAGLYAEGRSDYDFLLRLLGRVLENSAAAMFPGCEVGETVPIDAPESFKKGGKRAERIVAACREHEGLFELLVIHADADADARSARQHRVDPAIAALRAAELDPPLVAVPCIPVRMIEAWMLTDPEAFRDCGCKSPLELPQDPERVGDPKTTLKQVLQSGGVRRPPATFHALFGERVDLRKLRGLPAFQTFEAELGDAIRQVASAQGIEAFTAKR